MSQEEEKAVVVVLRKEHATPWHFAHEQHEGECCLCGAEVIISPTGQAFLESHPNAMAVCGECTNVRSLDDLKRLGEKHEIASIPGGLEDLEKHGMGHMADQIRAMLKERQGG